jgi:hypothetical protein
MLNVPFLSGWLAYLVVTFAMGYMWHLVLFKDRVFIASSAVLAEAAKRRVTSLPTWLLVESAYYGIQFTLCGLAMAFAYKALGR